MVHPFYGLPLRQGVTHTGWKIHAIIGLSRRFPVTAVSWAFELDLEIEAIVVAQLFQAINNPE